MSALLLGDASEAYTQADTLSTSDTQTYQSAWQFTALADGNVSELRFRTNAIANTGLSGLRLGIYADTADAPTTLLDSGTATGLPATSSWISVTGIDVDVVEGEKYWLAILPLGTTGSIHYNTAVASGGTIGVDAPSGGAGTTAPFLSPWGAFDPDNDDALTNGPLGFQALGEVTIPWRDTDLEWHITGLWYPGETSVAYYGQIADPAEDDVYIPLDDQRTGSVTVSLDEEIIDHIVGQAYARMVKVYDHGHLVFWGPYKLGEFDLTAGTCKLSFIDPSIRIARHYLRRGDLVIGEGATAGLTEENDDKGQVPVDHTGLRLLRDAGLNTAEQTADGYPDLGIIDGTNDYTPTPFNLMGVTRGDQVWNTMVQLSQSLGPDFELEPIEDTVGAYCRLNTYTHQGDDISALVVFHFQTGKSNLESLRFVEGAKYTTHAHILPRDIKEYRFTQANAEAAKITGPYVDWDATDYDSEGIAEDKVEDVLRAYGQGIIDAYGRPLIEVIVGLPVDTPDSFWYLRDFKVGDTVGVAGKEGRVTLPEAPYRITAVRRKRAGEHVRTEITVVGDLVAAAGDTPGDGEIV